MKAVIDIIKDAGKNEIIIARYNKDVEVGLSTGIMDKLLPDVGETLTNGSEEMTVTGHVVLSGKVGVKFANFQAVVTADQIVEMIENGTVRVK